MLSHVILLREMRTFSKMVTFSEIHRFLYYSIQIPRLIPSDLCYESPDKMVPTKWVTHKMGYGQNSTGQTGMDNMVRTKW